MGKIIRLTVTITTSETWTIVWLPDDDPLGHSATVLHNTQHPKEKQNETFQATLKATAEPEPMTPSEGVLTRAIAGRQRRRSHGGRSADNRPSS